MRIPFVHHNFPGQYAHPDEDYAGQELHGFGICLLGVFFGVALPSIGFAANDTVLVTLARGSTAKAPTGVQFSIPREYLTVARNLEKLTSVRGDTYAVL